jgi:hypothetical protein
METRHLEKKIRKYVIATISSPTMYLYKKPATQEYHFFKDVEKSIKFLYREDAEETIKMYKRFTMDTELDLVVLPVEIEYYLVQEDYELNDYNLVDLISFDNLHNKKELLLF